MTFTDRDGRKYLVLVALLVKSSVVCSPSVPFRCMIGSPNISEPRIVQALKHRGYYNSGCVWVVGTAHAFLVS